MDQGSSPIAQESRVSFVRIKVLRNTMPTRTASQRKELQMAIDREQADWYERVTPYLRKRPGIDPPFTKEYCHDFNAN